jgi:hypothetical protein
MKSYEEKQRKWLASCTRMLMSSNPGEVANAHKAIDNLLDEMKNNPDDIHALADAIEGCGGNGSGKLLDKEEMKKIFDAGRAEGYSAGKRDAENERFNSTDFHNLDGTPHWQEIVKFCQQNTNRIRSPREREFIDSLSAQLVYRRQPTPKQEKWLRAIFFRLGGKI